MLMASSSKPTVSSSSEEDVARGIGVQPYRFEPRKRSNSGDEESHPHTAIPTARQP